MNNHETHAIGHADRNLADFTIVSPVVSPRKPIPLENEDGLDEIDTVFTRDFGSLILVPFEFQPNAPVVERC